MTTPRDELQRRFIDLVEAHQGILHKVSALYAEQPDAREDLQQEILTQLWRSFRSFRGEARFSTWMYRVALNTALLSRRHRRRRRHSRHDPLSAVAEGGAPVESAGVAAAESGPDIERLRRCIRKLRELDRAVILLYLEQHTHEEIAELTGLTRGSVKVRVVRIKQRLRQCVLSPNRERGQTP
jgi:RNA polymerase sigma-70 factor (ECF subfamily)